MSEMRGLLQENPRNVIELKLKKVFSYAELREIFPVVFKITKNYSQKVNSLIDRLERLPSQDSKVQALEVEINQLINEWQTKIEKLGAVSKGLWIADFDSGDGYYCWKFPEPQILYWHGYRDGFSSRRPVKEYLQKTNQEVYEDLLSSDQLNHRALSEKR